MKKYFSILIIYLISTSTLFSQGPPIEESKTIALLSSTIYQNTSGQDVGYVSSIEYNIGYIYVEPNKRVYRSYFIVDLSVIPTNATIKTVSLEYFTEFKDETFKLTNIAALGGTNGAIWSSIGSSPTFHTGVAYGMSSFTSTPIKTAMQSALANRSMIIGALSTNEASINSKSNLSIVLTITYTRPRIKF